MSTTDYANVDCLQKAPCSFSIPENNFGFNVMHCRDGQPISNKVYEKLFRTEGPVTTIMPTLAKRLIDEEI